MTARHRRRGLLMIAALVALAVGASAQPAAARGPEPQIIGGEPAPAGAYPFIAAILDETISGTDWNKQFCGGSLIDPQWVLTAAHCVQGEAAASLAVAVGRTVLSAANTGQRRAVSQVFVHPSFGQPSSLAHDAALVRLASPVSGLSPVTLAGAADDGLEADGTVLRVIGWGSTTAKGRPVYPDDLQQVDVPAVADATCRSIYGASLDPATMVCAGAPGIDSCYGDSGGPMFATVGSTKIQVGIVSWGNGCAKKRFPGVYSEVNNGSIRGWITQITGV